MGEYDYLQKGQETTGFKFSSSQRLSPHQTKKSGDAVLPCMDMEGATDATGIGGMETPPKEL